MAKKKTRKSNDIRIPLTKQERDALDQKAGGDAMAGGDAVKFVKARVLKSCFKELKQRGRPGNRTHPTKSAPTAADKTAAPPGRGQPSDQDAVDFERFNADTLNTNESDRGCVLVTAGYIDVALEQTIKLALSKSKASSEDIDALLSGKFAPIGDLWSRTLLAVGLGLISPEHKAAIDEIRQLRNFFAHHPGPVDLSDARVQKIIDRLDEFGRNFASGEFAPDLLSEYSEPRLRFCFGVTGIYAHLNATHYQLSKEPSPTAPTLPESTQE